MASKTQRNIHIEIPDFTITSLNQLVTKHWRHSKRIKDETKEVVGWYLKGIDPIETPVEVTITVCWDDKRRRDVGNYTGKFLLDTLVDHEIIPDDNDKHIKKLTLQFERGDEKKTVINIIQS